MKNIKFLTILSGILTACFSLFSALGMANAGTVPGTITSVTTYSPTRSCAIDTVGGYDWPIYTCQQSIAAGCKYYNNFISPYCGAGTTSNSLTKDSNCNDSSTEACSGTCNSVSNQNCTNNSQVSACQVADCASEYYGGQTYNTNPGGSNSRTCRKDTYTSCTNSTDAACDPGGGYTNITGTGSTNYGVVTDAYSLSCNNESTVPVCIPGGCPGGFTEVSVTSSDVGGATNTRSCTQTTYPTINKYCSTYYEVPTVSSYITKQRYRDWTDQRYYYPGPDLGVEKANYCTVNAYGNSYMPLGYLAPTGQPFSCERGSTVTTYAGGADGSCRYTHENYNITSFNQTVGKTGFNTTSGTSASCTTMGLTATTDSTGPTISIGTVGAVFDLDQNNWCNYTKYASADYQTGLLPGCEYYKNKIPHASGVSNPDLLENMSVTVEDVTGISEVVIAIGGCTQTYNLSTNITDNVANGTSPSGANPVYKNITFNYNAVSTGGGGLPSLRAKFGPRLDACLREGKNFIKITAKDQSRSHSDGITYAPNTNSIQTNFLKVDNTVPKVGLSGDAANIAFSSQPLSAFVGGNVTLSDKWKNYSITGELKSTDPFGNNSPDIALEVGTFSGVLMKCLTSPTKGALPNISGIIWTNPFGVDPTTGAFTGYTYDGLGPIPDLNSCDWNCEMGLVYDSPTNRCVNASALFILFGPSTPEVSGIVSAKLTEDPASSRGLLKFKAGNTCLPPVYMTGSTQSYNFKYQAQAVYNFSTTPTGPFQIIEAGTSACPVAPPPPPPNTYEWKVGEYGACGGVCGATGVSTRTVKCQRSDGLYVSDSFCTAPKPTVSQSCSMPACQLQYRTRWCQLSSDGFTIGYGDNNLGALKNGATEACDFTTSTGAIVSYPSGSKFQTEDGRWLRCDTAQSPYIDIYQPIPESYCPAMPYCTAGGVVPCRVPPIGVQIPASQCTIPQNLPASTINLNCSNTSLASQWYKAAGRCGEQSGIDFWNNEISTLGSTVAKSSFDTKLTADCQKLADTTNIAQCFDRLLCGYGDYNQNTTTCTRYDCGLGRIDGVCGNATTKTYTNTTPSFSEMCSSGIPILVDIANGKWMCDGRDGGSRVNCSTNSPTTATTYSLTPTSATVGTNVTISNSCTIPPTSYTSSNTSVATVSGNTITTLSAGTTSITPVGGNCTDSAAKTLTVTSASTGTYPGCNTPDIVLANGQVWAACNVGATIPSTSYAAGAIDNPLIEPESKRGKYFQWGEENVAWDYDGGTTTIDACLWNRDTQSCGAYSGGSWPSPVSNGANSWSTPDARGPCALNYHVPTISEWSAAYFSLGSTRNTFVSTLKLPMSGWRSTSSGYLGSQGYAGTYWSTSPSSNYTDYYKTLSFDLSQVLLEHSPRATGASVRCLKNGTGPTTFTLSSSSVTTGINVTISNTCTTPPTSYTSSNTSVATVSGNTITTLSAGTTSITPVGGNCTDSAAKTLTVTAPVVTCSSATISDVQGNTYNTVQIGTQCWMKENLRTTQNPDGSPIAKGPVVHEGGGWRNDQKFYSCPPNLAGNGEDCAAATSKGMLYQWSAAMNGSTTAGAQGICPTGWHVPTHEEWTTLIEHLSSPGCEVYFNYSCPNAASKLATGNDWPDYTDGIRQNASNITRPEFGSSGFNALPTGLRNPDFGAYSVPALGVYLWSSSQNNSLSAILRGLGTGQPTVMPYHVTKSMGLSLRCTQN